MGFYTLSKKKLFEKLHSRDSGLTNSEVKKHQEKDGKNEILLAKKISFFILFLEQFKGYLVWLLFVVAAVAFVAGSISKNFEQIIDGIIISCIVLINAFVGAYQDFKSEKSAQLLRTMLKTESVVLRHNKKEVIDSKELVVGDIIFLKEGFKVPADCRIIDANELKIDESTLTGESVAVSKNSEVLKKEIPLAEQKNMAFMNTFVTHGDAICIITEIGKNTEVGKIAKSLEVVHESQFLKEVDVASKKITYVALSLIVVALAVFYFREPNIMSLFLLGSALVIGSIPEGLPAIVTFTLSMGSSRLATQNVLVKRKTILETLGGVDIICTDKTGTLTQNKMSVKKIYSNEIVTNTIKDLEGKSFFTHLRNCALLCNEAKDTEKGFIGEAEDLALIDIFNSVKNSIMDVRKEHPRTKFVPFSSETKFTSSFNKVGSRVVKYTKGAPEVILNSCSSIIISGKVKKLTSKKKTEILEIAKTFSKDALRNIGLSYNNIFLGLVGIYDPPREGIPDVVKSIYGAGIELKMITGDNITTAESIAKECGFEKIKAISWNEMKGFSETKLKKCVLKYNVFARMSPEFKLRIVSALQESGNRVAITGDGVNDVPALKQADVGVAMGLRGSDIAKEAADLIILDDHLESIVAAIKEGRTIFSNIRKVINYLLTANLAEVLVVFIASLMGLMPFIAIQLLWVNFVTDIMPAMALGVDPSHKNILLKKPTGKNESLINKRITLLTVGISVKKVIIMFGLFYLSYKISNNLELAQTLTFTWLVFSHFVRVAAIRFDEHMNFFINKFLNWSVTVPVLFQLIILYTPLSKIFKTVPLTSLEWTILIISVIIAIGLAKVITYFIDKGLPNNERDY